jgi:putative transposase
MPRRARVVYPGSVYHVTQRGNNRQYLFNEDNDYILYLKRVNEYSQKFKVDIYAYCIMGNHVHFIIKPKHHDSMSQMFRGVHMRYAKYFQKKTSSCGHVWQGRYFSCLLDESHIRKAIRYVELNPVRAKMVKKAWDYPWSSARAHLGKKYEWILFADVREIINVEDWKGYLIGGEDAQWLKKIRQLTKKNLAFGPRKFILDLESKLGRKIMPNAIGRPRNVVESRVRPH